MKLSLENHYAVVCGSTQGIGHATAMALSALGATCILIARNQQRLAQIVTELPADHGQNHQYQVADFTDPESVRKAIKDIVSTRNVSILINNSGGPKSGPINAANASEFTSAFQQHVICNQILANAVLPAMKKGSYGRIINIISTSVKTPLANLGVSNTIRAAVAAWAKTLSNEIGKYNITVNNVLPGLTRTARLQALIQVTAEAQDLSAADVEEMMINTIPMHRFGEAEDIANVIAFLASPAAAYVNGTSIPVDGGRTPSI